MSEQFEYRSVFAPYFDSFLKMKDTMGYGLNKFRGIFLELDRFFCPSSAGICAILVMSVTYPDYPNKKIWTSYHTFLHINRWI
jgi:hypothetical protein